MSSSIKVTFSDEQYQWLLSELGSSKAAELIRQRATDEGEAPTSVPDERNVEALFEAAARRHLKDQTLVELETSERIAERVLKWARIGGVFLAVPAAIFAALLSFLGVKTYFDLRDVGEKIAGAQQTIEIAETISQQSQAATNRLIDQANELDQSLNEADRLLARLRKLEAEVPQLAERQNSLEQELNSIAGGRIVLETSDLDLEEPLQSFIAYLDRLGFPTSDQRIRIKREVSLEDNAYFASDTIVLGKSFWGSPSVAMREYMHHILFSIKDGAYTGVFAELESAVADYFPASFLDEPKVGKGATGAAFGGRDFVRDLALPKSYGEIVPPGFTQQFANAHVWGSLFWRVREIAGRDSTDTALLETWRQLPLELGADDLRAWFSGELLNQLLGQADDPAAREAISGVWNERGFPAP